MLSGGGFSGEAWMLNYIKALVGVGVDLAQCDLVIGTSAGARVATHVGPGSSPDHRELYPTADDEPDTSANAARYATIRDRYIQSGKLTPSRLTQMIVEMDSIAPQLQSEIERKRSIQSRLGAETWPTKHKLLIVATRVTTGEREVFQRRSRTRLLDAITASGALPGVFPLSTIGGARYADGGLLSPFNMDLAIGADLVLLVSPLPLDGEWKEQYEREVARLSDSVFVPLVADEESLVAIGPVRTAPPSGPTIAQAAERQAILDAPRIKATAPSLCSDTDSDSVAGWHQLLPIPGPLFDPTLWRSPSVLPSLAYLLALYLALFWILSLARCSEFWSPAC